VQRCKSYKLKGGDYSAFIWIDGKQQLQNGRPVIVGGYTLPTKDDSYEFNNKDYIVGKVVTNVGEGSFIYLLTKKN
jgi:hypothetical protein